MLRVDRLSAAADLDRLAPEWRALWRRVPQATPFQAPEWLLPWWRSFGTGRPIVLAARAGDRLVGLLPLYRLDEGGVRKLLPIGVSLSDYLDALADPAIPGVADALLAGIAAILGWDECALPDLPPDAALLAAACPPGLAERRSAGEPCPVLPLPDTIAGLAEIVPRKTLRDLRQARARAGGVVAVTEAAAGEPAAVIDAFFDLHRNRWQRRGETGAIADAAVEQFHRAAARALSQAGMLRLYLLRHEGRPIAAYYGFAANGAAYAYLGGFDPDCGRLSPGAQILGHAVEAAIAEGRREFHFLRGGEPYKYRWGAVDRHNTCRVFRR